MERSSPKPVNIYSLHPGSWRRGENGVPLSCAETAALLIPYVKDMGYTHVDLVPGPAGVNGRLAPAPAPADSRLAPADSRPAPASPDPAELADACRRAGIGVVTRRADGTAVSSGGGVPMKLNREWLKQSLYFFALEPGRRPYGYEGLASAADNAFCERHVLAVTGDDAVKSSLVGRWPGGMEDKFADARVFLAYMTAHPGKKLLFMGCEFGQLGEWNPVHSLDWHLLDMERHRVFQAYVRALNHLYLETPALWSRDFSPEGFEWLCRDDHQGGTLAFYRAAHEHAGGGLVAVFNFSEAARVGYRVGVPSPPANAPARVYREVFNSDSPRFGGRGAANTGGMAVRPLPWRGRAHSIQLNLPPRGAVFLMETDQ